MYADNPYWEHKLQEMHVCGESNYRNSIPPCFVHKQLEADAVLHALGM